MALFAIEKKNEMRKRNEQFFEKIDKKLYVQGFCAVRGKILKILSNYYVDKLHFM